jgi:hypothetical protein
MLTTGAVPVVCCISGDRSLVQDSAELRTGGGVTGPGFAAAENDGENGTVRTAAELGAPGPSGTVGAEAAA